LRERGGRDGGKEGNREEGNGGKESEFFVVVFRLFLSFSGKKLF
jgi:hypothetical protein